MLVLDFVLLILIAICIAYCWMLNRRIQDLQNSRVEFARMIKELNVSIVKAEASVKDLSEVAKITSTELKTSIDEAKINCQELQILTDLANSKSQELSEQISKIKQEQRDFFAASLKDKPQSESHKYSSFFKNTEKNSNSLNDKFTDEDLIDDYQHEDNDITHKNELKSTITNITTKKIEENNSNMNYYDTLRRISAKK